MVNSKLAAWCLVTVVGSQYGVVAEEELTTLKVKQNVDGRCLATSGTPSSWGHLYLEGGVESLEFFTSMFSTEFSCEAMDLVMADPPHGCSLVLPDSVKGKAVLVERGECSFSTKAEVIADAGGLAMIVENNVDSTLFAMPDNDMPRERTSHKTIQSVMVRERTGLLLRHHLKNSPTSRVILRGEFSKDNVGNSLERCGKCVPPSKNVDVLMEEAAKVTQNFHGGKLHLSPHKSKLGNFEPDAERLTVDFLVGFSGASLPVSSVAQVVRPNDGNEDLCDVLVDPIPPGSFILAKRGTCVFSIKMQNAFAAGAWGILIVNSNSEISLPAVPEAELDPAKISFQSGSLMSAPIIFHNAGNLIIKKMTQTKHDMYLRFQPTSLDISDLKEHKVDINDLAYWQGEAPEHVLNGEHVEMFIKELKLNDEHAEKLRSALALDQVS